MFPSRPPAWAAQALHPYCDVSTITARMPLVSSQSKKSWIDMVVTEPLSGA
jgi:hypothetical protein